MQGKQTSGITSDLTCTHFGYIQIIQDQDSGLLYESEIID